MAWGYWSATSVLPDRGRSPRKQSSLPAPTPAPVSITSNPSMSSEIGPENNHGNAAGSTTSEETEELPSRRPSLDLPTGPPRGLSVVLCGGARTDSLRRRYIPDDKDIILNQQECYVHAHQPLYAECHIHSRERMRRTTTTDGLSDSEEESSDPGYASGIKMFTLCSDNEDEESEPGYESGGTIDFYA